MEAYTIGVGPTSELNLRVSVATLVRVEFPHPEDGEPLLALEHKATLVSRDGQQQMRVKAQPFGGAVRFLNLANFQKTLSQFHYDSELARAEQDARIFIRPSDWEAVRDFCLRSFSQEGQPDLETLPTRELIEEFEDTLGINLAPHQYTVKSLRTLLENKPTRTENERAYGLLTVRVYRVFEAQIIDTALCQAMVANAHRHPSPILVDLATKDAQSGGLGRANAIWVAPLQKVFKAYQALPTGQRNTPLAYKDTLLHGNVPAILEGLDVPKYQITQQD